MKIDLEFAAVTVVTIKMSVFWEAKLCSLKRTMLRENLLPPIYDYPKYNGSRFHQTTGNNLLLCTALHPRRQYFFENNLRLW